MNPSPIDDYLRYWAETSWLELFTVHVSYKPRHKFSAPKRLRAMRSVNRNR